MQTDQVDIIYQDEHYVAINKPSGLLVHPTIIDKHEKTVAMKLLRNQLGKRVYVVHRLDKPTSGILLFALDQQAANKCSEKFARREMKKTYLAVIRGFVKENGQIDNPLQEVEDKILNKYGKTTQKAKDAVTRYQKLAENELAVHISRYQTSRYSLVQIRPETGRMHQIRRHFSHIRHPIIGDTKYGDQKHNRYFKENLSCNRLLLAATELTFTHPYDNSIVKITAPLDTAFSGILETFNWQDNI